MRNTHLWNKFNLYGYKIIGFILVGCFISTTMHAQIFSKWATQHNPNYDRRKISYGFHLGLPVTAFQLRYDDRFVTQLLDTVHSVISPYTLGFSSGFLVNLRLGDYWDVRAMPQAGFYGLNLTYRYTNKTSRFQVVESTLLEIPIMLKYKSLRRGNVRMYMTGGVTPSFQLSGKKSSSVSSELDIKKQNFSINSGLGFDFYYPFFKLSIEVRFSKGIVNMLNPSDDRFAAPLHQLRTNTIGVYFIFQ